MGEGRFAAWKRPWRWLNEDIYEQQRQKILARAPVPVFWLFGKTGSGKTTLIHFLTGADEAVIGDGFRPQTRFSREYVFPSAEAPLVTFLDTRGLGEATYDPADDLAAFDESTHVVIVTARLTDRALQAVVEPLQRIREAKPHRPVLLVLSCLHEAYPMQQHPDPDPFTSSAADQAWPESLAPQVRQLLELQQQRFAGLVDRIVPLDITKPAEGFQQRDFGGARLKATLLELLPAAYRQSLLSLDQLMQPLKDLNERRALPYVLGYSTMAAAAAAVPLPWVDIPIVTAVQSHLVHRLAQVYGQRMNAKTFLRMAAPLAGRIVLRSALREVLKVVPYVGMAVNASAAYAYTYGLGKACCWYFGEREAGNAPSAAELEKIWQEKLSEAAQLWKKREPPGEASSAS